MSLKEIIRDNFSFEIIPTKEEILLYTLEKTLVTKSILDEAFLEFTKLDFEGQLLLIYAIISESLTKYL